MFLWLSLNSNGKKALVLWRSCDTPTTIATSPRSVHSRVPKAGPHRSRTSKTASFWAAHHLYASRGGDRPRSRSSRKWLDFNTTTKCLMLLESNGGHAHFNMKCIVPERDSCDLYFGENRFLCVDVMLLFSSDRYFSLLFDMKHLKICAVHFYKSTSAMLFLLNHKYLHMLGCFRQHHRWFKMALRRSSFTLCVSYPFRIRFVFVIVIRYSFSAYFDFLHILTLWNTNGDCESKCNYKIPWKPYSSSLECFSASSSSAAASSSPSSSASLSSLAGRANTGSAST